MFIISGHAERDGVFDKNRFSGVTELQVNCCELISELRRGNYKRGK